MSFTAPTRSFIHWSGCYLREFGCVYVSRWNNLPQFFESFFCERLKWLLFLFRTGNKHWHSKLMLDSYLSISLCCLALCLLCLEVKIKSRANCSSLMWKPPPAPKLPLHQSTASQNTARLLAGKQHVWRCLVERDQSQFRSAVSSDELPAHLQSGKCYVLVSISTHSYPEV